MMLNMVTAGAHTTYFLARVSDKLSELPIHLELSDLSKLCVACKEDQGENDSPLECEKVCVPLFEHPCLPFLLIHVIMIGADWDDALQL